MSDPYKVVRDFESALCDYTGAKYAVTTNSCTMALLLACAYHKIKTTVTIPKRTYVSVPQSIIHAGHKVAFEDLVWEGIYQLKGLPVFDSARYFTAGMFTDYFAGKYICVSFHASKILGDTQGGAVLHDNSEADRWLRRARFDGRAEGVAPKYDVFDMIAWHCYMSNDVAARLLHKLRALPLCNKALPNDDYPDLSKIEVFK